MPRSSAASGNPGSQTGGSPGNTSTPAGGSPGGSSGAGGSQAGGSQAGGSTPANGSQGGASHGGGSTPANASRAGGSTPANVPHAWAALGQVRPLWIERNRPGLAADAAHPGVLAYCIAGAIEITRDGGTRWTKIPTAGVVPATAATGYPITQTPAGVPACTAAVPDPAHPDTVYASFSAGKARVGMPPVYNVPVYTTDAGAHWKVVQPPAGSDAGRFGQFTVESGAVAAVFATGRYPAAAAVTRTTDGGTAWGAGSLDCPAGGPCVAWGPAASGTGSCAMHAYAQPVEASADRGRTWTPLAAPAGSPMPMLATGCALGQLVALSPTRVALVANDAPSPRDVLRISDDRGKTWHRITLPALPGGGQSQALQMLPDGSLLAPVFASLKNGTFGGVLDLLPPAAAAWCTIPGVTLAGTGTDASTLQAAGGRLWWVERGAQGASVRSVSLRRIHC